MKTERIAKIEKDWKENPRWKNVTRPYTAEEVVNLQGSVTIEHTIAKLTSQKLWDK
ncbi:MAG TPA: isocitrate lyase, partial [Cytophagales bacterium]|nr:isocitrate lyase [Cytophagales bacterium]